MDKQVKILLILYCSFLITMLFSLVPASSDVYDFFPLYDIKLSWQTYIYFFCEHISKLMVFYALYLVWPKPEVHIVFWIEAVDLLDFALIYNETWFRIMDFPVEYNDIKFVLIVILIIQTAWKQATSFLEH